MIGIFSKEGKRDDIAPKIMFALAILVSVRVHVVNVATCSVRTVLFSFDYCNIPYNDYYTYTKLFMVKILLKFQV